MSSLTVSHPVERDSSVYTLELSQSDIEKACTTLRRNDRQFLARLLGESAVSDKLWALSVLVKSMECTSKASSECN